MNEPSIPNRTPRVIPPQSMIEDLVYPPSSSHPAGRPADSTELCALSSAADSCIVDSNFAHVEQRIAEEAKRNFEAGLQRGRLEGALAEQEKQTEARNQEERRRAEQWAEVIRRFDDERHRYLHAVEQEVVRLALAIAGRILRREAQMDPLLLTGAVRVALGQLAETTKAQLLVPPSEFELWRETIEHIPNLRVKPQVVAANSLLPGDCMIETQLGTVDLAIRSQLAEIERGFFDRPNRDPFSAGREEGSDVSISEVWK